MELAELTTLRLGGPARHFVEAKTEEQLIDLVRVADEAGDPVLLVAGGSNLVVADGGFDGAVIKVATSGFTVEQDACSGSMVTVSAGHVWDDLVSQAIDERWVGIEALSGIPGSVGATPIQNVGAYGQEVSDLIASVRVFDRHERRVTTIAAGDCGFSYRHSRFKAEPGRYVVLSVTFQFALGDLSAPVKYSELAQALRVQPGQRSPAAEVREAVLALRSSKGMVLDANDHDTWSAGSFFTNPILSADAAAALPQSAPRFAQPNGRVKTSAAWLIDHAGFNKGFGNETVRLSTKHPLAVTNRGHASTAELLALATQVRDGVWSAFAVELEPEPVLVGCAMLPVAR